MCGCGCTSCPQCTINYTTEIQPAIAANPTIAFLQSTGPSTKERRERIATAVLAGFAAAPLESLEDEDTEAGGAASLAVDWADALIAELDK